VTRGILTLVVAVLAVGCRQGEGAPADPSPPDAGAASAEAPVEPLDLPLAWTRLPLLPPGVQPAGWGAARAEWRTATVAYAAGDMARASRGFMAAASALRAEQEGEAEGRVASAGRCLAYENAARALEADRDRSGARALLEGAADEDPACRHTAAVRIARLENARTASASVRKAGAP
jgi:hypothetical protein